ncbi:MAG TPA: SpoIIE family protein phosphatase [Thermoleophilaceae bacterium]|nr:SpoIIE family protein phosphatase [Thermoleophilaceae bacterium]
MPAANILIVDDLPENLMALRAVLEPLGHRIVEAGSGEEALKRLLEEDFAVALLDVQMPGLDGFETAEYIRRRERTQHLPIIFLTAIDKETHHVFRGYSVGAVDYLFKPFEPEILRSKVSVFVELHQTTGALRESEERFRAAFADAPIGIGLLNREGRFTQVNRALCDLAGRSQAELIDTELGALSDREDALAVQRMMSGELPSHQAERRIPHPDGQHLEVLVAISPTVGADGEPVGFIVQMTDLTERSRAEREREERMREQGAREQAEAVADTIRKLQSVADVALAHLALDDLLRELCEQVSGVFSADSASILLAEPHSNQLKVVAAVGPDAAEMMGVSMAQGEGFAGRMAVTRAPAVVRGAGARDGGPVRRDLEALMGAPLVADGRVQGVLEVGSRNELSFTTGDLDLLQLVADRAARAIEHAQLYARELDVAETLQRSLLPASLPHVAGLDLAARYLPGGEVGGDWYDVIPLADDGVMLAVGDVVGHGLQAASLMGQLRHALRALALDGHTPGEVIERLDRLVALDGTGMATVACMALSPELDSMRLASAGHLPPLVVDSDGAAAFVEGRGSVPLGVRRGTYEEAEVSLGPSSRLILYTDGLVEDRGSSIDAGLEALREAAAHGPSDPEALCAGIVAALGREGGADDDVTLLVAGTVPAAPHALRLVLPADPGSLRGMRIRLGRWLETLGATASESQDIQLASHEACCNSMEHGYDFGDQTLQLEASQRDGGVAIVVRDEGRWREPTGVNRGRGRGIDLMRELMGEVEVTRNEEGTRVEMTRPLERLS